VAAAAVVVVIAVPFVVCLSSVVGNPAGKIVITILNRKSLKNRVGYDSVFVITIVD